MTRDEFLQKVLPLDVSGNYVATISFLPRNADKPVLYNRGFSSVEALSEFCGTESKRQNTTYFALGVFRDNAETNPETGKVTWRRLSDMAVAFKTLAIDIDCGEDKAYPDAAAGGKALIAFLQKTGLPAPMVVSSGYGLHCYWPLTASITRDEWVDVSRQLRAMCIQEGLHIDESKVCDPSMVLRPIDTCNWKRGTSRPVRLVRDAPAHPFSTYLAKLASVVVKIKPTKVTASPLDALIESFHDATPIDAAKIVRKCAQVRTIVFNGGANAGYEAWRASLGIAAYCDNPEETAVEWSMGHVEFDASATIAKMEDWKAHAGPTTCAHFSRLNKDGCNGCKFANRITSPIQLGKPSPKSLPLSTDPLTPSPVIDAPRPFMRTARGIEAVIEDIPVPVCSYDLFPTHINYDPANKFEEAAFMWNKPHRGYVPIKVEMAHIFADTVTDLNNTLANNGLLIAGKEQQKRVASYMRLYIQALQQHQATHELHTSFGWKDDGNTFVIGTTQYRREADGTVSSHEVGISRVLAGHELDKHYTPKGDYAMWQAWTKVMRHPEMKLHGFVLGAAFASPLIYFTGLSGALINLVGDTGGGKTTMQLFQQSVFGFPAECMLKKDDTQLAIVQRMGMLSHLPVTIDEVTHMPSETLANFAYWASQGADRRRQTDTLSVNRWATLSTMSSNKSVRDKLITAQPGDDATLMRLVEFSFTPNSIFSEDQGYGRRLAMAIAANYGHAGRVYILHLLAMGPAEIRRRWEEQLDGFEQRYGAHFVGKERFWFLIFASIDLGLQLAKEADIIQYDVAPCTAAAIETLHSQREIVRDAIFTPFDALATYLNSNLHAAVTVEYDESGRPHAAIAQPVRECYIRKELNRDPKGRIKSGFLYIDRIHFRKWATDAKWDFKKLVDHFGTEGALHSPNAYGRISMGKHTQLRIGQVPVIGFDLSHSKLSHMLDITLAPVAAVVPLAKDLKEKSV